MRLTYKGTMDVPPRAGAIRLVLAVAVASALLLAGCASRAETPASGESPGFNAGGPMEVHASPTEAVGEQVRVPDVEGEDWEDAAHTVLDAGFEFGNVVAVTDGHPRWSVISQSPTGGSLLEQGEDLPPFARRNATKAFAALWQVANGLDMEPGQLYAVGA